MGIDGSHGICIGTWGLNAGTRWLCAASAYVELHCVSEVKLNSWLSAPQQPWSLYSACTSAQVVPVGVLEVVVVVVVVIVSWSLRWKEPDIVEMDWPRASTPMRWVASKRLVADT